MLLQTEKLKIHNSVNTVKLQKSIQVWAEFAGLSVAPQSMVSYLNSKCLMPHDDNIVSLCHIHVPNKHV